MSSPANSQIKLITLSSYVRPKIEEQMGREYVLNGPGNKFYDKLIDCYTDSPTNSSIIKSYSDLTYGRGLDAVNKRDNLEDWIQLKKILNPLDLRRIVFDFWIFGEYSFQVVRNRDGSLNQIKHVPRNFLAPQKQDDKGEINYYYYSRDFKNPTKDNTPQAFPVFSGNNQAVSVYVYTPYGLSSQYYADPDYVAGLPYAEMERELANLNINAIKNGLSAGYIINVPDGKSLSDEEKDEFERLVRQRLTGSPNAMNFILSFNGRDVEITVTPFPQNEQIHRQWEFLTGEAKQQILTAHRATSPSIVGIISSSGFSNTADEMDTAEEQLIKRVIKPKQDAILDGLTDVLVQSGINLQLVFKSLTEAPVTVEEEESTQTLSLAKKKDPEYAAPTGDIAEALIALGEDMDDGVWQLLCEADVHYDTDQDLHDIITFASTGTARPNAKSEQDSDDIAIRYRYAGNPRPEREFCVKMMAADKRYRKEDIQMMSKIPVNPGFGMGGTNTYDIWLWKGGGKLSSAYPNGTCKHFWKREIYLKRGGGVDVNSPLAKTITVLEARRRGFKVPQNDSRVAQAPHRMR